MTEAADESSQTRATSGDANHADELDLSDELNFDELLNNQIDEETTTSNPTKSDIKKRIRAPVLICLLCAFICIIATLLILFVIPSRYRIWPRDGNGGFTVIAQGESANQNQNAASASNQGQISTSRSSGVQTPLYSDTAPAARSDEIVVAPPEVETVAPVRPAPSPRTEDDIIYRIKWGDTLWDISEAYYRNPWRYGRIAAYNNIRDPDYIISGTVIRIPSE